MVKKQLLAALALGMSMSAHAADFSEADAKFALRDTSRAATLEARAAYKAIIDQGVTGEELVRAGEGYLRAYIYEGVRYTSLVSETAPVNPAPAGEGRESRKALFGECWSKAAETLAPAKLGFESPVYYYFRASCIAYEAEVSTALERLMNLVKLNKALETGLATTGGDTFEGGGLMRVKAAVLGNPEAKGLPGVYNPKQALVLIDQALASEAFPGNLEGVLFCENFRRKIGIQIELEAKADALALAEQTLGDFQSYLDNGLLPEFIRAETVECLKTVAAQKDSLN